VIDNTTKPCPSYAPIYAMLYPELAAIARRHGYALAAHGSLRRDFDLIAVPWVELPSNPITVIREITSTFDIRLIGEGTRKLHGRTAYSISLSGQCALDLSFMDAKHKEGK